MSPLRWGAIAAGLACWCMAFVHGVFGYDTIYAAIRDQVSRDAIQPGLVYWEVWSRMFWVAFGMIMSAMGGIAIGWAIGWPGMGRARKGKIRNVVVAAKSPASGSRVLP